jgi:hypothetical protein
MSQLLLSRLLRKWPQGWSPALRGEPRFCASRDESEHQGSTCG